MNYAFYISGHSRRLIKFLKQRIFLEKIRVVVSDCTLDEETQREILGNNIDLIVFDRNSSGNTNKEKNMNFSDFLDVELKKKGIDYLFSLGEHILSGGY